MRVARRVKMMTVAILGRRDLRVAGFEMSGSKAGQEKKTVNGKK
jgi:hypothetical protein